jgi:hypothetical protein
MFGDAAAARPASFVRNPGESEIIAIPARSASWTRATAAAEPASESYGLALAQPMRPRVPLFSEEPNHAKPKRGYQAPAVD